MRPAQTPYLKEHLTPTRIELNSYRFLEKLSQQVGSVPSNMALSMTSNPLVEKNILNPLYQQAINRHCAQIPTLSKRDLKIVEDLETFGVSVTSLETLGVSNTESFITAAEQLSDELEQLSRQSVYRARHTLTASARQLLRYPEVFYWGLNDRLLAIAERYLKLPVAYDGLSYYYSIANGKEEGPRKWHRDKEDWRMIKVGVYFNSVADDGGPIECIYTYENMALLQTCKPYQVLRHSQIKQLLKNDSETWYRSYTGTAGTVIFIDTARFYHRGKPPLRQNRSAAFFSYFSDRPKNPFFCERSPLSQKELRQLANPLPENQRKAVLWKDSLPGIGRWIPKNRVTV